MKKVILFLLLGLIQTTLLFPQVGVLKPDDYKYYIRTTNNEIRDSRDFKIVYNQFPAGETRLSSDKKYLLVHNATNIYCMNSSGKLITKTTIPTNASLSPKWDKILYTENGDLWTSEVNCKTGKIDNKQKITELGIFGPNTPFKLASWYDDIIAVPMYYLTSEDLRIDLKKKSVEPLYISKEENYSRIDGSPSPDGRFLIHTGYNYGANISINDLQNNKVSKTEIFSADRMQRHIWINENQFLAQGKVNSGDWFIFDIVGMQVIRNFANIHATWDYFYTPGVYRSSCVSLNGTYVIFHSYDTPENFLILNVKNGKTVQVPVKGVAPYIWLSDDKLLYSEGGTITKQGTWILDAQTGETKKVTNYQSSGFVNLPSVKQVLFSANNLIWRVNQDGTDLTQITNAPQNYFGLKDFINFPDLELGGELVDEETTQLSQNNNPSKSNESNKKERGVVKTQQGSNLRLRSKPSDQASIIMQIPNGSSVKIVGEDDKIVTIYGEKGKWLKIEYEGVIGWAWGNFILKN